MAINAQIRSELTVVETTTQNIASFANDADHKVTHSAFNLNTTLTGTSLVPASVVAAFRQALTAGAATIDLTNLPGTNGLAVSLNGLKPQAIKFRARSSNANPITIGKGAANGYTGFGAAFSISLKPGQEAMLYTAEQSDDVAAGCKTLDLAGTGAQELDVIVIGG